ncbi:hypothetical protein J2T60_001883 [Natronospira proteinivora]|uniref:Glycosyltransferase family 1 protein n=1 Tax=Natronospira proteinivora TaxID=1807133 RepID=A0ABT1GC76_9GAMM|nr:hypothetical protein [Natronospira proteinivora]MCP1727883.1 hypothetical protein [Natronospira proteinivora]
MALRFLDEAGERLPGPYPECAESEVLGAYRYLPTRPGSSHVHCDLPCPPGARQVQLALYAWSDPDLTCESLAVQPSGLSLGLQREQLDEAVTRFLAQAVECHRRPVIIRSREALGSDVGYVPRLIQAWRLAGHPVVQLAPRAVAEVPVVQSEDALLLRIPDDLFAEQSERLLAAAGKGGGYLVQLMADTEALHHQSLFAAAGWHCAYYLTGESQLSGATLAEGPLARQASVAAAAGPVLAGRLATLCGRDHVPLWAPGREASASAEARPPVKTDPDQDDRPTVVYWGSLAAEVFDWPTLLHAARARPDVRFYCRGEGAPGDLPSLENLIVASGAGFADTAPGHWRVAILPLPTGQQLLAPWQWGEFRALGLPVLLPAECDVALSKDEPLVHCYADETEFLAGLDAALDAAPVTAERAADGLSWQALANRLLGEEVAA